MSEVIAQLDYAHINGDYSPLVFIASFVLFCIGAVVASLSGLIASRIGSVEDDQLIIKSISFPPSYCEACNKPIKPLALLPFFGWFLSKGKCSCCKFQVPVKYPLVEGLVGLVSALMPFIMGEFGLFTLGGLVLLWVGVMISWIDWKEQIIPEELTWFLLFSGFLFSPFELDLYSKVIGAAMGCGAVWLTFLVVGLLKNVNTHAGGDVALAAAAGAWLGISGAPTFILLSSLVYIAYALPLRFRGIIWVPMGPALAFGLLFTFASPAWLLSLSAV